MKIQTQRQNSISTSAKRLLVQGADTTRLTKGLLQRNNSNTSQGKVRLRRLCKVYFWDVVTAARLVQLAEHRTPEGEIVGSSLTPLTEHLVPSHSSLSHHFMQSHPFLHNDAYANLPCSHSKSSLNFASLSLSSSSAVSCCDESFSLSFTLTSSSLPVTLASSSSTVSWLDEFWQLSIKLCRSSSCSTAKAFHLRSDLLPTQKRFSLQRQKSMNVSGRQYECCSYCSKCVRFPIWQWLFQP